MILDWLMKARATVKHPVPRVLLMSIVIYLVVLSVVGVFSDAGFSREVEICRIWIHVHAGAGALIATLFSDYLLSRRQRAIVNKVLPAEFRVTNINDGSGLLCTKEIGGRQTEEGWWTFTASPRGHAVYGPYLRQPLFAGRYVATFRIKVDKLKPLDPKVLKLDVASNVGRKEVVSRTITARDFEEADRFKEFRLPFDVATYEPDVETRVFSFGGGETVTLDHIRLEQERA